MCGVLACGLFVYMTLPWDNVGDIDDIDYIDLTDMNKNMVYSYVYDMLYIRSESYIGKTVKAKGRYDRVYDNKTERYFHFLVVEDAVGCCAQGLEFEYENDYPEEDIEIEVVGTFEKYNELGITWYYLKVSEIKIIQTEI
jgi:hypothetical protein